MLGREAIGDLARFVNVRCKNDQAVAIKCRTRDGIVATAQLCFRYHLFGKFGARGDEDGQRIGIMLGLRHKIGGNIGSIATFAGDDDFRGAGKHIYGAIKSYEALGRGDIKIAGADDLVHALEARGSVGQRGDCMRAAQAIELRNAEQMRGGERFRSGFGRDDHDALNAGHLRGTGGHQQRGGQRMAAAGHVATHRAERAHKLACGEAGNRRCIPRRRQLALGKAANLLRSRGHGLAQRGTDGLPRSGHFVLRHAQRIRAGKPVELGRIAQQSAITLFAHIGDNALDCGQHAVERRAAALFERSKNFCCLPRASSFGPDHFHRSPPGYRTTLLSGYSTMPVALAAFRRGITSRATRSSTIVLTATQSESLNCETVGEFNAGSTARTASRSARLTLSIRPTCDWASMAPRSMSAIWSSFSRFLGSARVALPAIRWVSLSMTVSIILRWLALSELPVSVTSTMASASVGGLTSVAPQLNSTFTLTPLAAK